MTHESIDKLNEDNIIQLINTISTSIKERNWDVVLFATRIINDCSISHLVLYLFNKTLNSSVTDVDPITEVCIFYF
jgi:hypothetical protein